MYRDSYFTISSIFPGCPPRGTPRDREWQTRDVASPRGETRRATPLELRHHLRLQRHHGAVGRSQRCLRPRVERLPREDLRPVWQLQRRSRRRFPSARRHSDDVRDPVCEQFQNDANRRAVRERSRERREFSVRESECRSTQARRRAMRRHVGRVVCCLSLDREPFAFSQNVSGGTMPL